MHRMNLDTFMKVKGYACIYKANEERVDDIMLDDITITLVRESKPKKLFQWFLKNDYNIAEVYRGIYYVTKEKEGLGHIALDLLFTINDKCMLC